MNVQDLMAKLTRLYPNQLAKREQARAWEIEFQNAVGEFEGDTLERAYQQVMKTWEYTTFPKPGNFRTACLAILGEKSHSNGHSSKQQCEYVKKNCDRLVAASTDKAVKDYRDLFESQPPIFDIRAEATRLAERHLQAKYQVEQDYRAPESLSDFPYELSPETLETIHGRVQARQRDQVLER